MLSKSDIQNVAALRQKKFRQKYNQFIVEGEKMSEEVLSASQFSIVSIFAVREWLDKNARALKSYEQKTKEVSETELKLISGLTTPNKVVMLLQIPLPDLAISISDSGLTENIKSETQNPKSFFLYLDGIQDPGNMGTIWRIADWFGIENVLCSDTCVDTWNPKVIQACMGAFLRVRTREINFAELKKTFPAYPIYGAVLGGDNIFGQKFAQLEKNERGIIVVGNEGNGISPDILREIQYQISIPRAGKAESLNAAVATGIICAFLINS